DTLARIKGWSRIKTAGTDTCEIRFMTLTRVPAQARRMERTQMSDNYWQSLVGQRLSRRRALAVAGGGSAAAFLAACGGGSDSKGSGSKEPVDTGPKDASGLLAQRVDTSSSATKGDSLKSLA